MKGYRASFIIALFLILFNSVSFSQLKLNVRVSANNQLRYGNGKEIITTFETEKKYFEELGDVRLFVNDFVFGARYEYDDPIEFGKGTKSISSRYFEFKKDEFSVRAGNFYDTYSKGLSLNAFENRGLGINMQLDGIRLGYKKTFGKNMRFEGKVMGGDLDYTDYTDTSRTEKYSIRNGNFLFSPEKFVTLGGSYLYTKGELPVGRNIANITAEIFEGNLGLTYKDIDFFASYANKKTFAYYPSDQGPRGDGFYSTIAYTKEGFGITLDYKNYRFNVAKPNERGGTSPVKPLPFQVPPSAIKYHTTTLLSRYPHQVDFGDEVGFQLDAIWSPNSKLSLNLNSSLSSRHYTYTDIDPSVLTSYQRVERSNAFLPSPKDAFSPYWEVYLEAEYYLKKNLKIKAAFGRQSSVVYNDIDPSSSDKIRTVTVPVDIMYDFKKIYSLKVIAEQQWVFNSLRAADQQKFYNEYLAVAISRSPNLVFSANLELSTDKEDPSGKKHWESVEATYKFTSANTITISYGSERGGLKCTSGICRYVNPFKGVRFTITNNFN